MDLTTIPATCTRHGAAHFCNLRLTKTAGTITLDPHVDGGCVVTLDEAEATKLVTIFASWLGLKVVADEVRTVIPRRKPSRSDAGGVVHALPALVSGASGM